MSNHVAGEQQSAAPPLQTGLESQLKITIRNLTKVFGAGTQKVLAIDDLSLDIQEGEFFTIVGPSGCGKTTLLRILAGLEKHTTGEFSIVHSPGNRPESAIVFQGDSIFPWMTVYQNAAYGLTCRHAKTREIGDIVRPLLEKTGLWTFKQHYPHQLSGGMRQRVSIVRAFATDPEILLMDEPFSALDEQNRLLLQEELLRIWDNTRKTVVFITHSVDEAVTLSDRMMVMSARPGTQKALIDVPFERPREVIKLRTDPVYGEMVFQVWDILRDEVSRARMTAE